MIVKMETGDSTSGGLEALARYLEGASKALHDIENAAYKGLSREELEERGKLQAAIITILEELKSLI
ncbi:hypothetical protein FRC02_007544 [Tulasnella sp. 418]|nr:hypothetical protein FRC02_007544 [Tulasnella sp. 418]